MVAAAGIIIAIASCFAGAQGTVVGSNQKYWLAGAWLAGMPLTCFLLIKGL